MKQLVEEMYQGLKYLGLVENQYEFSINGFGRGKAYLQHHQPIDLAA